MQLTSYDLNSLVSLQALLEERNVTRAGERIGLTQSAMSNALARLRRQYNDDLLVRNGRGMELTPLAHDLLAAVGPALQMVERVLSVQARFDPASTNRTFEISGSDYALSVVAERIGSLPSEAPNMTVDLNTLDSRFPHHVDELIRACDLLVSPRSHVAGYPGAPLSRDAWVALVDTNNEAVGERLSEDVLRRTQLVRAYPDPGLGTTIEMQLRIRGVEPRGRVTVRSFLTLPFALAGTDCVGFLPRRMAQRMAAAVGLRVVELDFEVADLVEWIVWHPSLDRDEGHAWFRERLLGSEHVG